ncbi:MAG: glycosyltransferase family 2 protein [Candidatus Omnitrophica bacterium]|nr:glycosyltransferase family 2 protein [Candidatus Omnitrophota bacterium]
MIVALVPVYNEEIDIIHVLERLIQYVDALIVVNDGSSDSSHSLITRWRADKPNVFYLFLPVNKGMSTALLSGFKFFLRQVERQVFSLSDAVVTIDADGQHDPQDIPPMHEFFKRNNLDVLIGRRDFTCYPYHRVIGNKILSLFASLIGGYRFQDVECGFKILSMSFLEDLIDYYIGFRYSCANEIGVIAGLLGYRIDNSYDVKVARYRRRGPIFFDLFLNSMCSLLVSLKIRLKRVFGKSMYRIRHFLPDNSFEFPGMKDHELNINLPNK